MNFLARMVDDTHSLDDMALLVRRAGLTHLISEPTPSEVLALAKAGDVLTLEWAAAVVKALNNPAVALKQFDDGEALRAETKALAYALSRKP